MIVLAVVLMSVAVFSGVLGVLNATRAEVSNATLGDRYLVLGPAVRGLRASVAAFQLLTQPAFSGGGLTSTALTGGRHGLHHYRPVVSHLATPTRDNGRN